MLVLRKEIKIGIGAGLTILGIAAVYGLIAALSNGSGVDHTKDQATADVQTDDPSNTTANGGRGGLPPVEPDPAKTVEPTTPKPSDAAKAHDPFAESNRPDGNTTTDPWATAFTTGRVNGDVKGPSVIKSPTDVTKSEAKLVSFTQHASDNGGGNETTPAKGKSAAKVATPPTTPATPGSTTPVVGGSTYKIEAGDTFSTISAKVYGSKKYYAALAKANPDVNPSRLKIGHEITVPPKEQIASVGGAIEPAAAKIGAPIDTAHQYRIAAGDTLSKIASKLYGKSAMWEDLYEKNKTMIGPDSAKLKVGTVLELPEKPTDR